MVYNALKLFMEINPTLFDEAMQHYKQQKLECVSPHFYYQFLSILRPPPTLRPALRDPMYWHLSASRVSARGEGRSVDDL